MPTSIEGILPAVVTPYDKDGQVDKAGLVQLVNRLILQGAAGLFVGGTTAEFPFLTVAEREMISETVLEAVAGRVPVVVHVGALQPPDVSRLARHAAGAGASAISSVPPFYYGFDTKSVVEYISEVADSTSLPLFYYHIPPRTGVHLDLEAAEAIAKIPNVVGMKDSSGDLVFMRQMLEVCGDDFTVLCGSDEIFLPALMFGAKGAVGSTYNFLLPHSKAIWTGFKSGDLDGARETQCKANAIMRVLQPHAGLAATKEVLRLCGLNVGEPRKPHPRLTSLDREVLADALTQVGFWQIEGIRSTGAASTA